jgi:Predicted ATPase (AAA+ superfamily)
MSVKKENVSISNPFLTSGYISAEYFCDREEETKTLTRLLTNGNNVALISPRRMGKTGLIRHCFAQDKITRKYYTFVVDIYATKNLCDFVYELGRQIVNMLKPRGKKALEKFIDIVKSLRTGISFDVQGVPSWNVELGDIQTPSLTLDEIFAYIEQADKPCLIAIDEFQSISYYPEKNVEATLRTYVQQCNNAHFIFSGSQRSMMGSMFTSAARPFYQSVSVMNLGAIAENKYAAFIKHHFEKNDRRIADDSIHATYEMFDGVTWYIQKAMNYAYSITDKGDAFYIEQLNSVIDNIVEENSDIYKNLLFMLTPAQKQLLIAIGKEKTASAITGRHFIKKYSLASASSVQKAVAALMDKQIVTNEQGVYEVYDRFLSMWLRKNL